MGSVVPVIAVVPAIAVVPVIAVVSVGECCSCKAKPANPQHCQYLYCTSQHCLSPFEMFFT
jgi:hypothetical protein